MNLPCRDDGDDNNGGGGGGGGGGGYEVACNLLKPGKGEGGLSTKYVLERLRELIEDEKEEDRRRCRSAEDGAT